MRKNKQSLTNIKPSAPSNHNVPPLPHIYNLCTAYQIYKFETDSKHIFSIYLNEQLQYTNSIYKFPTIFPIVCVLLGPFYYASSLICVLSTLYAHLRSVFKCVSHFLLSGGQIYPSVKCRKVYKKM